MTSLSRRALDTCSLGVPAGRVKPPSTATPSERAVERVEREIPPLSFRAAIRPDSINPERRTAEVIWTTGARVLRGFFDRYYEELSLDPKHVRMARLNNGAPLVDSHSLYNGVRSVLGVVESAKLEAKRGTAVVRFAKAEDDPEADAVFRKVKDGILQNISVGYRIYKLEKIEDGAAQIPVYRATDWEPHEISIVPAGADDGAGFRGKDHAPNPCVFVEHHQEKRTMDETETTTASTEAAGAAEGAGAVPGAAGAAAEATRANDARVTDLATRAERERAGAIRTLVKRARLGDELATDLVTRGVTLDAARAAVLDKLATADEQIRTEQHVRAEAGEDEADKWQRGAAAAIYQRAMMVETIRAAQKIPIAAEQLRDVALDPGEFRGMSLVDLARASLERRGVKVRGLEKMRLVGEALTFRSGLNTTSDFAVLLENVMHKTLLAAYATTPDTWRRFCTTRSVPDFRVSNFYRNGSFGTLDSLNEHGEFKNKNIPDGEKTTISVGTKGNIIGITRQAIVNDDLGAFNDLATRFGRAAALSIESDVYALLLLNSGLGPNQADGQPLFHTNRKNIGTSGAMTAATIDGSRVVMGAQKDPSGNEILDLRPAILLVPAGLAATARVLNGAPFDPLDNKFQKPNPVQGLFRDIIDTARLTGTRHYMLAEPNVAPIFAVAFLEGQQAPVLESELGWRVDGTEWKIRIDYGVAAIDWRGAITAPGA